MPSLNGPMNEKMASPGQVATQAQDTLSVFFTPGTPNTDFAYLSPEGLMAYIEVQLQQVDSNISAQMGDLQSRRDAADALANVTGVLKQAKSNGTQFLKDLAFQAYGHLKVTTKTPLGPIVTDLGPASPANMEKAKGYDSVKVEGGDPDKLASLQGEIDKWKQAAETAKAAGFPDLANEINGLADGLANGSPPDSGQIDKVLSDIESTTTSLSSSCEMTQIKLQDLMQQRSRIVMFVSNALASLNDAAKKIVENTR